jgi:hypothetical protein
MQQAVPAAQVVSAGAMKQQLEQELPSSILHFNWDQRQAARAAMNTLVQALADDPVNNYFSGSKRVRFVKDEVRFSCQVVLWMQQLQWLLADMPVGRTCC